VISICHHTIIVDDVAYVDDKGIPRTVDGSPVMIFDLSNTIMDIFKSIWPVGFWPTVLGLFIFNKGDAMFIPLVEYGDSPVMLRMDHGEKTEKERNAIVQRCTERFATWDDHKFNLFTNNCEHMSNSVALGENHSIQVSYAVLFVVSAVMRVLPYMISCINDDPNMLGIAIVACICYFVFEQIITVSWRMAKGWRTWKQQLEEHDYKHVIAKEISRALLNVGLHIIVLALFWQGLSWSFCSLVFILVPVANAILADLGCHLVMLILFVASGSVWHFPPRSPKIKAA